jgi:hypothetical protein
MLLLTSVEHDALYHIYFRVVSSLTGYDLRVYVFHRLPTDLILPSDTVYSRSIDKINRSDRK